MGLDTVTSFSPIPSGLATLGSRDTRSTSRPLSSPQGNGAVQHQVGPTCGEGSVRLMGLDTTTAAPPAPCALGGTEHRGLSVAPARSFHAFLSPRGPEAPPSLILMPQSPPHLRALAFMTLVPWALLCHLFHQVAREECFGWWHGGRRSSARRKRGRLGRRPS